MNTSFERSANASDEWYTPREIIEALGEFDLDPCAPCTLFGLPQKSCTTSRTMVLYKIGGGEFGLTLRTPNRLYGSL